VIREVIEKAQAGVFCPPGNPESLASAIQKLSQDPQSVQSMGNCGREYIEAHFDRAALGERLAKIIESMETG
jgi:glycosyltransferase involved in cell wall biosynthesis